MGLPETISKAVREPGKARHRRLARGGLWLLAWSLLAQAAMVEANEAIRWQPSLDQAKQQAMRSGRLVLVHVWAPWCGPCRRMERDVLARPEVAAAVARNYEATKLNWDEYPDLAKQLGVDLLPSDVVLNADGRVVQRFSGPSGVVEYIARLDKVAAAARPTSRGTAVTAAPPASGPPNQVSTNPVGPAGPAGMMDAAGLAGPADGAMGARGGSVGGSYPAEAMPPGHVAPPAGQTLAGGPMPGAGAMSPVGPMPGAGAIASAGAVPSAGVLPPGPGAMAGGVPGPGPRDGQVWHGVEPAAPLAAAGGNDVPPLPDPQLAVTTPIAWGLDGYCPVTLAEQHAWRQGDRRWGANYEGRTYLMAGPTERQRFLEAPERYAPAGGGIDLVLATDQQVTVAGKREFGNFYFGRVYLFAGPQTWAQFERDPERYAQSPVLQAQRAARAPR